MKSLSKLALCLAAIFLPFAAVTAEAQNSSRVFKSSVREVNDVQRPNPDQVIAIVGATLIDGRGSTPVADSVVIIRGERIAAVGKRGSLTIPTGAEIFDGKGLTLLPGLIDSHFHIDGDDPLPALGREMQRVLGRGDRDGHDRRVQHHHQLRDAEQGQDRPSIRFTTRRVHRVHGRQCDAAVRRSNPGIP